MAETSLITVGIIDSDGGPVLITGPFLDTFTEAGPGNISQGVPHTPNIDENPNGLDWAEDFGAAPAGLAEIDSATNRLVPITLDEQVYGGAQIFRLDSDADFELALEGDAGSLADGNEATAIISNTDNNRIISTVIRSGVFGGGGLSAVILINVPSIGFGLLEIGTPLAPGDKAVVVSLQGGILGLELNGGAGGTVYTNVAGALDGQTYRNLAAAIAGTVAGTYLASVNVRNPTLATPAGGGGDFQDLFNQDGLLTASTPAADPFGAGWQSNDAPSVSGGVLVWSGATPKSANVPVGGFGQEFEVEIAVTFGGDDSRGVIDASALGQFGTGFSIEYETQDAGANVRVDLFETGLGESNLLSSNVYSNPGSGVIRFAYKQSAGKIAQQLDANAVVEAVTARVITPRHFNITGRQLGAAMSWGSIDIKQTATIL